jgi:hypothetical protein
MIVTTPNARDNAVTPLGEDNLKGDYTLSVMRSASNF